MMQIATRFIWTALIGCLLSMSVSYAASAPDNGDAQPNRSVEGQAYYDQIQSVLSQKAFGEKEKVKRWRLKEQKDEEDIDHPFLEWLLDLLSGSSDKGSSGTVSVAKGLEVVLWIVVVGLIVFLLLKYRTQLAALIEGIGQPEKPALPSTMFGLDVKKTSMPEDVISSAQALWQSGEQRQAIALLLRASLIKLLHDHQCVFYDSDTEAECCARIDKQVPATLSQYMRNLVQVWQEIAYGHRIPADAQFNTLCQQWQEVF